MEEKPTVTVRVSDIPRTCTAKELSLFFESLIGKGSVFACDIVTGRKNWKSRGFGRIQFETLTQKSAAISLFQSGKTVFRTHHLSLTSSFDDIILRPVEPRNRMEDECLYCGFMSQVDVLCVVEHWEGVKVWVMPERKCVEFWVDVVGDCYKLEVQFSDVMETHGCSLNGGSPNAVLLKLKHAPKIYQKISGPDIASRFRADRYHMCKENFEFLWVRTTDFSGMKSIGHSSVLCLEFKEGLSAVDIFSGLSSYKKDLIDVNLLEGEPYCSPTELVPLVRDRPDSKLAYEILFQLNSLVHTHKISLPAVDAELIQILSNLDIDIAMEALQHFHKLHSTCFEPVSFIKTKLHVLKKNVKNLPSASHCRLTNRNIMSCHRVFVTPSKIYCLGPELETSNYVVKNFAEYASDFLRVTFVEEDWGRLSSNTVSTSIHRGIFSKPYRTNIYNRILTVLREGILIGTKRFQFLAFSASQLRSNAVWMFASNDHVRAEDVREWMGCFDKFRNVSKCAARMGQLFSSSTQTLEVAPMHVDVIPDIEVTSDGVQYCFSDGIGKISQPFARQVAQKCGLTHVPSAFQIRYGGYKGVIAVDRNSFRKLSLRSSMRKFESKNRMLNITSWSQAMPCYLNREIITLLSTLGVEDEVFVAMQDVQLRALNKMLECRKAALDVLNSMNGSDINSILVKMLLQGYEPNGEPYLSMILQSHRENQLSDLRSRCRIFVPKGRILIGCLDETGTLNYGQVFVRLTLTKADLESCEQSLFHKVDETSCILVGKVVVTKNPCLHPGDIRVLDAVYDEALEEKGLVDCLVFPQKGDRPHPNECSGGDLDGDLYFVSWDTNLIPCRTVSPMDYTGRRPRITDHDVTLEEIQKFFVDYLINDTLGMISTAHLIHADREADKAMSAKCLQLATLHSMAVDFAKTGAPAEMPGALRIKEFPDFTERMDKPSYISQGALGKLYRATIDSTEDRESNFIWSEKLTGDAYDHDLIVDGFESFIGVAQAHKEMYLDKLENLMNYYDAESEDEILTGNLRNRSGYLQRDNRRYGETKERILLSVNGLHKEATEWFETSCNVHEHQKMASAWYHVTYHLSYSHGSINCLGFPWIVGNILLDIKSVKSRKNYT